MKSLTTGLLSLTLTIALLAGPYPSVAQRGLPAGDEFRARADQYAEAVPRDVALMSEDGRLVAVARCATGGLTPTERALVDAGVPRAADASLRSEAGAGNAVRVVFHVIHDGEDGRVDVPAIRRQMRVLRRAFQRSKFTFRLSEVTYTDDPRWHRNCHRGNVWRRLTRKLAVDPERFLNIYVCRPGAYLGSAYLPGPWSGAHWDGVRVLHSTLPGGTAEPYHLGDTVVHEVGHYLGLDHTFYGGCRAPGDAVADTPFERGPDYVCDESSDSCPQPGTDPVHNYMDYGPDTCLIEFTPGQRQRMNEQVRAYRPGI
jgi:hypothetical protein